MAFLMKIEFSITRRVLNRCATTAALHAAKLESHHTTPLPLFGQITNDFNTSNRPCKFLNRTIDLNENFKKFVSS